MTLEKKIFDACLWLFAACVLVILLTSCSPYAVLPIGNTPTPSPSATVTTFQKIEKSTPTPAPSCTVTGYLNFRTKPSRQGAVIRVLERGEELTILPQKYGDWLKVQAHGRAGYVYKGYCK